MSNEYASILHQKVMDKEVAKEIREQKKKEREDKMAKCVIDSLTPNEKETQRIIKSHVRIFFDIT
jgi:signal recognition particle GTPase